MTCTISFLSAPHPEGRIYTQVGDLLVWATRGQVGSPKDITWAYVMEFQLDHVIKANDSGVYELWRYGEDGMRFLDEEYTDLGQALEDLIGEAS